MDDTEHGGDESAVCAGCGAAADGAPPLTWTWSVEQGTTRYFCASCSRTHIRAIEGRLDSSWW